MSVQNIQTTIQNSEQYKIRKQTEAQQAEELQNQIQQAEKISQEIKVDEYDKANPVGEEIEGIYSVSHDEAGNLKIEYKQPASNSKTENNEKTAKNEAQETSKGQEPKSEKAAPVTSNTEESDDDDDDEIEKLKKQRDAIKQQINRETDESAKSILREQLQSIEMQIALKSSGSIN